MPLMAVQIRMSSTDTIPPAWGEGENPCDDLKLLQHVRAVQDNSRAEERARTTIEKTSPTAKASDPVPRITPMAVVKPTTCAHIPNVTPYI